MTLLGSRYLTFVESHSSVRRNKAHTLYPSVTLQQLVSDRTSSVSSVWAGRGGRQQEALEVGCHHRHRPTEHSTHTAGVFTPPGCSQKCDGRKHCFHSRKACLSRVCLPESGFLSPICSQVIWTGAAYVYLRGAFMTYVHTSWDSDV